MNRHYYGAYSYMGVNYTFDSPCWTAYQFNSKTERDAWVASGGYQDGNRVKTAIKRADVDKIIGGPFALKPGGNLGELDRRMW